MEIYAMGTHQKPFVPEALLMSTHNLYFHGRNQKNTRIPLLSAWYPATVGSKFSQDIKQNLNFDVNQGW